MVDSTGNTLSDFPSDQFDILAYCESCGHRAKVNREAVPAGTIVQDLPRRLRCSVCGATATARPV